MDSSPTSTSKIPWKFGAKQTPMTAIQESVVLREEQLEQKKESKKENLKLNKTWTERVPVQNIDVFPLPFTCLKDLKSLLRL